MRNLSSRNINSAVMLLPSMTYRDMYDHLAADKYKVDIRKEYLRPKAVKAFRKTSHFPAWELYEYKVPATNNRYVIYFYAATKASAEHPEVGSFCIVYAGKNRFVVKWGVSGYQHTPDSKTIGVRQISAYTHHFFQRYKERSLKDESLSDNEAAARYLSRNPIAMPIRQNDGINRNHEKYGEYGRYAFRVRDGICFAHTEAHGVISDDGDRHKDKIDTVYVCHTTFMNESGMTDSQRNAIFQEHCEQWLQLYATFQKEADNGAISLRLEP